MTIDSMNTTEDYFTLIILRLRTRAIDLSVYNRGGQDKSLAIAEEDTFLSLWEKKSLEVDQL